MYSDELNGTETMDEDYEDASGSFLNPIKWHAIPGRKYRDAINKFLGKGLHSVEVYSTDLYYGKLLAWTVKCITALPGWKTVAVRGYSLAEPIFRDIQTDYTNKESCLTNGQMLVEKDDIRLVITVMVADEVASTWIEAAREHRELVKKLIRDIEDFLKKNNFYRGKKLCFGSKISFLNTGQRDWASVILDPAMKKEIHRSTIGFLKHCNQLADFGMSSRRGIILSGEPGTGKTIVCKALISEANNITCITTDAYGMLHAGYISALFAIAQDLSPSIVFIEEASW